MKSERRLYQLKGSSDAIEEAIAGLRESDKEAEEEAASQSGIAGGHVKKGLLVALAAFFLGLGGESVFKTGQTGVYLMMAIWGAGLIYLIWRSMLASRASSKAGASRLGDIDDARYEQLQKLHFYLKADCDEATEYSYDVDFRNFQDRAFIRRELPFRNGREIHYLTPIISAQVKLRDGTLLKMGYSRKSRVRAWSKTNPRGKVKSKHKSREADLIKVELRLPFTLQAQALPANTHTGTRRRMRELKSKVEGNRVTVVAETDIGHPFRIAPALELAASAMHRAHSLRGV